MCSFTIGNDGSLAVTVGAQQALAVHVGALGVGTGAPSSAQQVPVLFYENATTTYGEVGNLVGRGVAGTLVHLLFLPDRTFSSWEACRNLATGTRPTRYVAMRQTYRFWSLILLRHRYRSIRLTTPSGLRQCTCLQTPRFSTNSSAMSLTAVFVFFFLFAHA
jgi:hypothetical protein